MLDREFSNSTRQKQLNEPSYFDANTREPPKNFVAAGRFAAAHKPTLESRQVASSSGPESRASLVVRVGSDRFRAEIRSVRLLRPKANGKTLSQYGTLFSFSKFA